MTAWIQPFYSWKWMNHSALTAVFVIGVHACLCKRLCCCCCCCTERGRQQGWLWGSSPGVTEQVCTPQQPACSEKPACMWKRALTCSAENPSRKQEKGGSLLRSIAFHIPHLFTSDLKMGQLWHKSETEKPVQHYTRNPSFGPHFCVLTTCRESTLCLCTTLMTIKQYF